MLQVLESPHLLQIQSQLQALPALIEEYLEVVERVLVRHGFDSETCQFALNNVAQITTVRQRQSEDPTWREYRIPPQGVAPDVRVLSVAG